MFDNPSVGLSNLAAIASFISGSEQSASGEKIDEHTALSIIEVYSCVKLISSTISTLPLKLYERLEKGRREAVENNLYSLLTVEANPEMNSVTFWQTVVGCMALTGNAYIYVQRVGGQVIAMWPLNPMMTRPVRINGVLKYECQEGGLTKVYDSADVMHMKLFSFDGVHGLSPIKLSMQDLGLAKAATKMGARIFANGGRPSQIVKIDGNPDPKMLTTMREAYQSTQTGSNSLKTLFLPSTWSFQEVSLDFESIEFLKTRQFERTQIASLFSVPVRLIGDTSHQSSASTEQEMLNLTTLCLRPYLVQIEVECQRVLLPSVGRNANRFFVNFDMRELLRSDFKTQSEAFQLGRNGGWFSANEIRSELGYNPIGSVGDVYLCPVNYSNAENLLLPPVATTPQPALDPGPVATVPDTPANDPTTEDERSIVRSASSVLVVFRDALGRLLTRDNKSLETIASIFEPCLRSITTLSIDDASKKIGVKWLHEAESDKLIADVCKSIHKRCTTWTSETADQVAGEEFRKVLRQIVSGVYKELGSLSLFADGGPVKEEPYIVGE